MRVHACDVAKKERGVEVGLGNSWMRSEQSLGAIGLYFGCRMDELLDSRIVLQRQLLDAFDERVPRCEAELTRDDRLRIVERHASDERFIIDTARERGESPETRERVSVVGLCGAQQVFRLALELL